MDIHSNIIIIIIRVRTYCILYVYSDVTGYRLWACLERGISGHPYSIIRVQSFETAFISIEAATVVVH